MAEDTNEEQASFKVADRRKFNVDGSLREGFTPEEPKPQQPPTAPAAAPVAIPSEAAAPSVIEERSSRFDALSGDEDLNEANFGDGGVDADVDADADDDEPLDELNIPDAENPAGFANFLMSLASQAASAMGLAENPMTGRRSADLELSRYWLDVLGMLREKTNNNLHPQEQKLFDGLLGDLRMQFVQLARVAEAQKRQQDEQLLKTAGQKFSGKDILGQ